MFLCCRAFRQTVRQQGFGSIVIIGSHAGIFGEAGDSDYAAAKAALNYGLCTSLKTEIARVAPTGRVKRGGSRVDRHTGRDPLRDKPLGGPVDAAARGHPTAQLSGGRRDVGSLPCVRSCRAPNHRSGAVAGR